MTNKRNSKASKATTVGDLLTGTKKRFPNASQVLTVDGAQIAVGAIIGKLQGFLDDLAAAAAAKKAHEAKVAAVDAELPALNALVKGYIAALRVQFGSDVEALGDFGLEAPKAPTPMTAEQKAIAVAKREATRAARGTKSAKQKKVIHGNVTAQVVVTTAAPSAATTAPPATTGTPGPTKA